MRLRRLFKSYSALFGILCSAVFCLSLIPEARADTFSFTTFTVPGGIATLATGINNSGEVVGWYLLPDLNPNPDYVQGVDGFLLAGNALSTVAFPGAVQTFVTGINNNGEIVGYYSDDGTHDHGFTDVGGTFTSFDFPGGFGTYPMSINDGGQIVGTYDVNSNPSAGDFYYSGFLDNNGAFTSLNLSGTAPGSSTVFTGINNNDEIVGYYSGFNNQVYGFLLNGIGGTSSVFTYPGAGQTQTYGINDSGQSLGCYFNLANGGMNGCYVLAANTFTNLVFSGLPAGAGYFPNEINDSDEIVGAYYASAYAPAEGFIATPTPEPPSCLLLGASLLGIGMLRIRYAR